MGTVISLKTTGGDIPVGSINGPVIGGNFTSVTFVASDIGTGDSCPKQQNDGENQGKTLLLHGTGGTHGELPPGPRSRFPTKFMEIIR